MFKSLDVLIGLAVVMLVLSLAVTVVTQFINSQLLNLPGRALRVGLGRLLTLLDPTITLADGERVADYVLRHNLVSRSGRLAQTVHREEFTKLVLDYAGGGVAMKADAEQKKTLAEASRLPAMLAPGPVVDDGATRTKLLDVIRRNGVANPIDALQKARLMAMKLEADVPAMATNVRQTISLVEHVGGDFLAKINAWYDQTIDRVNDLTNVRSRWATVAVSALLAIALHVNTLDVVNRLSNDTGLRDTIVKAAVEHPERFKQNLDAPAPANAREMIATLTSNPDFEGLTNANVIVIPASVDEWQGYWVAPVADGQNHRAGRTLLFGRIAGVLLTIGLLSLGAPLWYQLLGNLLSLRSIVARRDDQQRTERQTSQVPAVPVRAVDDSARQGAPPAA